MEHERATLASANINAIEHEQVKVHIEPKGAVSALNGSDRTRMRLSGDGRPSARARRARAGPAPADYRAAITDAAVLEESEVAPLTPLTADEVEVVTWTAYPDSFKQGQSATLSWAETWVTVAPELQTRSHAHTSYRSKGGFPWTRLGYTYDWGSQNEVGLSEYVRGSVEGDGEHHGGVPSCSGKDPGRGRASVDEAERERPGRLVPERPA